MLCACAGIGRAGLSSSLHGFIFASLAVIHGIFGSFTENRKIKNKVEQSCRRGAKLARGCLIGMTTVEGIMFKNISEGLLSRQRGRRHFSGVGNYFAKDKQRNLEKLSG